MGGLERECEKLSITIKNEKKNEFDDYFKGFLRNIVLSVNVLNERDI